MKKFLAVLAMGAALMGCDNKAEEKKPADTVKEAVHDATKDATDTTKPAEEKK